MVRLQLMAMPSKIEDSILLELISKGLNQKQIAEYFGVRPSSVRSKIQTCAKRDPRYLEGFGRKNDILTDESASLTSRLDSYALKMFSDAGNVLKRLQTTPIPDDIPSMIQRSDLQLKGLQIIEKVQKLLGMGSQDAPKTLNVTHISNVLSTPSTKDQDTQVLEG
jgi:hypothetical protein